MGLKKKLAALLVAVALFCAGPARSAINFPGVLDDDTTLFNIKNGDVYIAQFHNNPKDAIKAIEAKVGVDGSGVTTTLDYLLKNAASVDPGHKHTGSSINFVDGSAASPGIRFGNPVTDTNTGFFHPGTGLVAVSSSGVEIMRVAAAGVGFGTASVSFPVDVGGTLRIQGANKLCFGGTGAADNDTCEQRTAAHVVTNLGNTIQADQAVGDNSFVIQGIAAKTGKFLQIFLLPADTQPAMDINAAAQCLEIGAGGASAVDATICRTGAAALTVTGAVTISSNLTVNGTGTSTIGGNGATVTIGGTGTATVNLCGASGTCNIGNVSGGSTVIASSWTWTHSTGNVTIGEGKNIVLGTVTGTKIGTATTQLLGFYNATPVVQRPATTDIRQVLIDMGFLATGGATPLNLNGGALTTTGTFTLGTSGQAITRILTNGAGTTLDFASAAANTCSTDLTVAVTNAATGDVCHVGPPAASVNAGSQFTCWVSAAGTVTVRHCNISAGANDPASGTYKVQVVQQ